MAHIRRPTAVLGNNAGTNDIFSVYRSALMNKTLQIFTAIALVNGLSIAWAGDPAAAPERTAKSAEEIQQKKMEKQMDKQHMNQMHEHMDDMHKSMGNSKPGSDAPQADTKGKGEPQTPEHSADMHKTN
jgi:hypothetical protein